MNHFEPKTPEEYGFKEVIYEKKDWIARITINRPKYYNAYNTPCLKELVTAFTDAKWDDKVGVVIFTGASDRSQQFVGEAYNGFEAPLLKVDPTTAEIIKLASNSFLAMKISFINEIANIAEKTGSDVNEIAQGIGMDDRISSRFFFPN